MLLAKNGYIDQSGNTESPESNAYFSSKVSRKFAGTVDTLFSSTY